MHWSYCWLALSYQYKDHPNNTNTCLWRKVISHYRSIIMFHITDVSLYEIILNNRKDPHLNCHKNSTIIYRYWWTECGLYHTDPCILRHFPTLKWWSSLKSFLKEDKGQFILHSQYDCCWWPSNRSQGISNWWWPSDIQKEPGHHKPWY